MAPSWYYLFLVECGLPDETPAYSIVLKLLACEGNGQRQRHCVVLSDYPSPPQPLSSFLRKFVVSPQDEPTTVEEALAVIQHTHERWVSLMAGEAEHDADFWLGEAGPDEADAGGGW